MTKRSEAADIALADVLPTLDAHAARINNAARAIPAEMQLMNDAYLQALYPYDPDLVLAEIARIPIDTPLARVRLTLFNDAANDALTILREVVGGNHHDPKLSNAWTTAHVETLRQYPLAHDLLDNTFGFDNAIAAYVYTLDPQNRPMQLQSYEQLVGNRGNGLGGGQDRLMMGAVVLDGAVHACVAFIESGLTP